MATSVIRCSVVSSSAGRRNLCDSQPELGSVGSNSKSKSFSYLSSSNNNSNNNNNNNTTNTNTSNSSCACVRCHLAYDCYSSKKDQSPVEYKHQPQSVVSLGILSAKESPLLARHQPALQLESKQQLSNLNFSLRSATPAYASPKPQIDLNAVEALSTADMPAARINNMDINRNNGYLYNGVSRVHAISVSEGTLRS
ncbi:hypothetical protein AWZ03_004668 [Drosophila navojoa]|uniref:Uncharacterized protein n=1 Tax=Drosophila navojoa TaxID=7232 RepID=A0A484BJZ4_DRONA|nr:hypothetical protein AWZ03_004668 [Drosophila navojoa]